MPQKSLRTSRLDLVPLGPEHREQSMSLDMNAEVMKQIATGRPFTEAEASEFHEWLLEVTAFVPGLGAWAGFTEEEFVGWWMLAPWPESATKAEDCDPTKAEYGFRLAPRFWGRGFAKEGGNEMIRHAFQDLELKEVVGETMTVNAASRAVMAANGLKHVDTVFNHYDEGPAGIEEGEVRYSITREDYRKMA